MSMTGEDLFALWAPAESPWSVWAKPVIFADMEYVQELDEQLTLPKVQNFPLPSNTAAVIDVDGSDSVLFGLALAQIGYRPVPLYNSGMASSMLVDMRAISNYLALGAAVLKRSTLSEEAPPAFMLNADRLDNEQGAKIPGRYDNRWCIVPQDMPSADFLKDAGITQIALVSKAVEDDLSHVLYGYQEAGIPVMRTVDFGIAPTPETIGKPKFYKSALYRLEVYAGLRRNSAGGFGGVVPDPNSGGGFAG